MTLDQLLVLGWPIHSDTPIAYANVHPLTKRRGQQDLAHCLKYSGDGHCMTFAPTGAGKGVGSIIPNLLNYPGPAIVIDPKGENFAVTSRFRSENLGQEVVLLDPFQSVPDRLIEQRNVVRSSLNPLSLVEAFADGVQNTAQMISELLSQGGTTDELFWDTNARFLCSGVLVHEMERALKSQREASFYAAVNMIFAEDPIHSLAKMLDEESPSPFVRQSVGAFLSKADKERSGILSTLHSYLSTTMADDLRPHLDTSSFSIQSIVSGSPMTIYIVIPPAKLDSHSFLLRVWVSTLLHAVMERKQIPERRTLFVLDECANLGHLGALRKAVTLLRGYGLQVWMFFQDMDQLASLYGDQWTFINNCGVIQVFGISRLESARRVASTLGGYSARDLMRLHRSQQVVSLSPGRTRACKSLIYYADPAFDGLFDDNPMIRRPARRSTHPVPRGRQHVQRYL